MTFETAIIGLLVLFGIFVVVYTCIITESLISSNNKLKYQTERGNYWIKKATWLESRMAQKEILSEINLPEVCRV